MLVYASDKTQFLKDARSGEIDERIAQAMQQKGLGRVSAAEVSSWQNSMMFMLAVLLEESIPGDAGVAIEYSIPQTSKRVDFILTGKDEEDRNTAIIIELKQWSEVKATEKDAIVETFVGGAIREMLHPSYQAWSYAQLLTDFNESVELEQITLRPCAYLHNCTSGSVVSDVYRAHLDRAPSFLKRDAKKLTRFIQQHVRKGDRDQILYRIENGRIRPSKSLAQHLASLLEGNREFVMIDDQKMVYETAVELWRAAEKGEKQVLLVEGGPGTGKSVVAINLLVDFIQNGLLAHYVTRNAAPREVYRSKLAGTLKKNRIDSLFKGSGSYHGSSADEFDVLIVDEAHRLNERSGMFQHLGENQVREIIRSGRLSIFFLDEDQQVTWRDIGSRDQIERWAREEGAALRSASLNSQFRCNGSDGYLAWLDHALQIRETANTDAEALGYQIEVLDSPAALRDRIYERNLESNRARLLAGYCWDWISKKNPDKKDIVFPEYGFSMRWNLDKDGMLWLIQPNSVHEIGCIHTCQGLELDYVGVIIGPDLIVRDGQIITRPEERSRNDSSIKGYKKDRRADAEAAESKARRIILNTYRTLMSRGMKGCFLWSVDPETNEYFKSLLGQPAGDSVQPESRGEASPPLRTVSSEQLEPYRNAVPVLDFKAAAGQFVAGAQVEDFEWVALPDHIRPREGMFVAQVVGDSMNRRIPNGSWCLFEKPPGGTRQGKIVLVQHRDIEDPETGGSYTVKRYRSEKRADPEHGWEHLVIVLEPESYEQSFEPIVLEAESAADLRVIGEFKAVLDD